MLQEADGVDAASYPRGKIVREMQTTSLLVHAPPLLALSVSKVTVADSERPEVVREAQSGAGGGLTPSQVKERVDAWEAGIRSRRVVPVPTKIHVEVNPQEVVDLSPYTVICPGVSGRSAPPAQYRVLSTICHQTLSTSAAGGLGKLCVLYPLFANLCSHFWSLLLSRACSLSLQHRCLPLQAIPLHVSLTAIRGIGHSTTTRTSLLASLTAMPSMRGLCTANFCMPVCFCSVRVVGLIVCVSPLPVLCVLSA